MNEDIQEILYTAEELSAGVAALGKKIADDYSSLNDGKELLVVGILKGASMFMMDLIRNMPIPLVIDFMIASSYGDASISSGKVTVKKDLDVDVRNRHVLLVEDIIDTGITMECVMSMLKQRGAESVKLCALLSKPDRRKIDVKIDYCLHDIPDEFVVGYGLDCGEKYRNLPYVGVLKRSVYMKND